MYGNVGLATPRGSGTSGYVQKNRAFMRPRDENFGRNGFADSASTATGSNGTRMREPDQGILDHHRKRAIEVRVFELRDQLEEAGELGDDEIDQRCDELRERLTKEGAAKTSAAASAAAATSTSGNANGRRQFKAHQVHEQAAAKAVESERLRQALGISKDYQEGAHWRRQDEKMALKRKQMEEGEEEEEEGARARGSGRPGKRRERKYSDDDSDDDNGSVRPIKRSVEEESGGRPIKRSVEENGGRPIKRSVEENGGADRAPRGRGRDSGSDDDEAGVVGADDVRRPRQQRPRSYSRSEDSRSPSRSLSGSRSPSRSRSRSQGRAPQRRPIHSQSRSRSPRNSLSRSRSRSRSSRSSRSRSDSR